MVTTGYEPFYIKDQNLTAATILELYPTGMELEMQRNQYDVKPQKFLPVDDSMTTVDFYLHFFEAEKKVPHIFADTDLK